MRTWVRGLLMTGAVTVCVLDARVASAQGLTPATPTRDSIQPSVKAAVVYDSNVLAQPVALADALLRVSPLIRMTKASPRRTLTASYGFDAERYDTYTDLSAVLARTNALAAASFRPTPRRRFDLTGGYAATNNPVELNTTTSLITGRRRSNRFDLGGLFHQDLSHTTNFEASYAGNRDKFGDFVTYTNGIDLRLGHHTGARSELFVRGDARRFNFGQLGGTTVSNQIAGGWAWRGRTLQLTLDGGVARTNRDVAGTASVGLTKSIGLSTFNARYERGTTTAVGIPGAINVDHLDLGFSRQSRLRTTTGVPRGFRYGVRAAVTRNELATGEARIFDWSGELGRPITSTLIFVVDYEGYIQQTLNGLVFGLGGNIRRNRVSVGVQFAPWSVR